MTDDPATPAREETLRAVHDVVSALDYDPRESPARFRRRVLEALDALITLAASVPAPLPDAGLRAPIYCTGGCDVCRDYARELGVPLIIPPPPASVPDPLPDAGLREALGALQTNMNVDGSPCFCYRPHGFGHSRRCAKAHAILAATPAAAVREDHRRTCGCGHRYSDHATGGTQCLAVVNDPDRTALIPCSCHGWKP